MMRTSQAKGEEGKTAKPVKSNRLSCSASFHHHRSDHLRRALVDYYGVSLVWQCWKAGQAVGHA